MSHEKHGLSTLFYRDRSLLLLTVLVLAAAGISAFLNLPRMEDPRIRNRNPSVVTRFPGASAERVEALVTKPLEDDLREIAEVKTLVTDSRPGISFIRIELDDFTVDPPEVFTRLRDRVRRTAAKLPPGASVPYFDDQRQAIAYTRIVAISRGDRPDDDLTLVGRLADELADRFRNLPGTERAQAFGRPAEEIRVTVDSADLAALGLTAAELADRLTAADSKVPAGTLRDDATASQVEVAGELDSTARIAAVPLRQGPSAEVVHVGDVALVERTAADPPREIALSNGRRAVLVAARIEPTARIDHWSQAADELLREFSAGPGSGLHIETVFDQSAYVSERIGGIGATALQGGLCIVGATFLLMGLRAALIVSLSLPLGIGAIFFVFGVLEIPLHQMSIFGLLIAMGQLVDIATVVVDEVKQRLERGLTRLAAVGEAVEYLFFPMLMSTFATVLAFLPIELLPGNIGDFIRTIATGVITALLSAFLLAMTLTAALSGVFLDGPGPRAEKWWNRGVSFPSLQAGFGRLLEAGLRRPLLAVGCMLLVPAFGFWQGTRIGMVFFPSADRDQFQVEVFLPADASVKATREVAEQVDHSIREEKGILRTTWLVGASTPSVYYNVVMRRDDTPNYAHGIVTAESVETAGALVLRLERALSERFPDVQILLRKFGQGPPIDAPLEVRLLGPSLAVLRERGDELRRIMQETPQILTTRTTMGAGLPKLRLKIDEEALRETGLTPVDLARQLEGGLEGSVGGSLLEEIENVPVRVRLSDRERQAADGLAGLKLVGPLGAGARTWLPASAVAEPEWIPQQEAITRRDGVRCNTIEGFVAAGVNPPDATRAFRERTEQAGFALPPGYRLEYGGDAKETRDSIRLLLTYLPVLVVLSLAVLVLTFRSWPLAGLLVVVGGLSAGWGIFSLWVAGYPLGFNAILGMFGLMGLAFNAAIIVLAAILDDPAAAAGDPAATAHAVGHTIRHVLCTMVVTIIDFAPLLLFPQGEFWQPLAIVLSGGVIGSTLLALFFVPAAYRLTIARGFRLP